jgi:hypothetical protein
MICLWWAICLAQAASLASCESAEEWRTRIDAKIDQVRKADAEIREICFIGFLTQEVDNLKQCYMEPQHFNPVTSSIFVNAFNVTVFKS